MERSAKLAVGHVLARRTDIPEDHCTKGFQLYARCINDTPGRQLHVESGQSGPTWRLNSEIVGLSDLGAWPTTTKQKCLQIYQNSRIWIGPIVQFISTYFRHFPIPI